MRIVQSGTVYDLIATAIKNKQIVTATYQGCRRVMCPHVIGYNARGDFQALFYQFEGRSNSGLSADHRLNWRCIPIDNLTNIEISDGKWHTADNHTRPQNCVKVVLVEVDYR